MFRALACLLLLGGCSVSERPPQADAKQTARAPIQYPQVIRTLEAPPGADQYVFERKEYQNGRVNVTVRLYRSFDELRAAHPRRAYLDPQRPLYGFTQYSRSGNCTIHVIDPAVVYLPEYVGHEFMHCVFGNFHPLQDERFARQ